MTLSRVSVTGLAQAAGVLTMVFSLATLLQANFHALQLFSHFRLQYFVVSILLTVAFVVLRDRRYAVLLFATAFINAAHVLPWYTGQPYATDGRELKLVTANVQSANTQYARPLAPAFGSPYDPAETAIHRSAYSEALLCCRSRLPRPLRIDQLM